MKQTLLSITIGLLSLVSYGQSYISFGYDAAGNRETRTISMSKSGHIEDEGSETFEETLEELSFKMYPNPTKGLLTVEVKNLAPEAKAGISVFDLQGRQVYNNNNAGAVNPIDLSGHGAGTYILVLKAGDKTSEWKIVKK